VNEGRCPTIGGMILQGERIFILKGLRDIIIESHQIRLLFEDADKNIFLNPYFPDSTLALSSLRDLFNLMAEQMKEQGFVSIMVKSAEFDGGNWPIIGKNFT
jgi:hypothetical protein